MGKQKAFDIDQVVKSIKTLFDSENSSFGLHSLDSFSERGSTCKT